MKQAWLAPYTWQVVVQTNRQICAPTGALHKPTSDGYEASRELWERRRSEPMGLDEAVDLCRHCHRLAPFCNYNGNTFVAIIRRIITSFPLPVEQAALVRSLVGHIVAGTASPEEEGEFQQIIRQLTGSASQNPSD